MKAHWPLVPIAVAVAVLAFAVGAMTSNQGVADAPTPEVAPTPVASSRPAPTPTIPPYATPTDEEFIESLRALKKKQAASGNAGESQTGISRAITITATPRSTAEAQFREAPQGKALYFCAGDKVIFLPEDVEVVNWTAAISCFGLPVCPEAPVTVLKKGEATVVLDAYGEVVRFHDMDPDEFYLLKTDDPDAFPFLSEDDE